MFLAISDKTENNAFVCKILNMNMTRCIRIHKHTDIFDRFYHWSIVLIYYVNRQRQITLITTVTNHSDMWLLGVYQQTISVTPFEYILICNSEVYRWLPFAAKLETFLINIGDRNESRTSSWEISTKVDRWKLSHLILRLDSAHDIRS